MNDCCVLQVEDDANDITLLNYAFGKAQVSCTVKAVRDGLQALAYLSSSITSDDQANFPLPRLVLLDLKLPGKSGFEVLEWIRNEPKLCELPVIILSSSARPEDVHTAYRLGANAYLVKPAGADKLVEMVKSLAAFWLVHVHLPVD